MLGMSAPTYRGQWGRGWDRGRALFEERPRFLHDLRPRAILNFGHELRHRVAAVSMASEPSQLTGHRCANCWTFHSIGYQTICR